MGLILQFDECCADLDARRVSAPTGTHRLTDAEARLLQYLYVNAGRDVPRGELLQEVWGYNPSVRSRAVDQTMKRLRPKIEADPSNPRFLMSVYGVGYRLRLPNPEPGVTPTDVVPGHVPEPYNATLGRDGAVRGCSEALSRSRWVSLVGAPGLGKSRTALEVARQWRQTVNPPGGVWVLDMAGVESEALLDVLYRSLKVSNPEERSVEDLAHRLNQRGEALVVVDNSEALVPQRDLFERLHAEGSTHWLFTTRVRWGVPQEHLWELQPLSPEASAQLFEERGRAVSKDAAMPASDVAALVALLEFNPLAIELAASQLNLMSTRQIRTRFADEMKKTKGARSYAGGLDAAIEQSWRLLEDADRDALAALSVFRGRFGMPAAEAVLPDGLDLQRIQVLRDHSLIRIHHGGAAPTLSLSAWIRSHSRRKRPEVAARATGARDAYLAALVQSWVDNPNVMVWDGFKALLDHREDLQDALGSATDAVGAGWHAVGLIQACELQGDLAPQRRALKQLDRLPGEVQDPDLLVLLTMARWRVGAPLRSAEDRQSYIEALLEEGRRSVTRASVGATLLWEHMIGHRALRRDPTQAAESGRRAAARAREDGRTGWQAAAALHWGRMVGMAGSLDEAIGHFETAMDLSSGEEVRALYAYAHYCRGYASLEQHLWADAERFFRITLEISDEDGDPRGLMILALLGLVAIARGDLDTARRLLEQSARYGAEHVAIWTMEDAMLLGCVDILEGDLDSAEARLASAVEWGRRWGRGPGYSGPLLAACRVARGASAAEVAALMEGAARGHPLVDISLAQVDPSYVLDPPMSSRRGFDALLARRLAAVWRTL